MLEALRGTRGVSPTFDSIYGNITVLTNSFLDPQATNRILAIYAPISGGSGAQAVHNTFKNAGTAVVLTGGAIGPAVEHNAASGVGDGIALAAGPLLVASQTHNAILVSLAGLLQRAPWLLFGLYAGAIADRVKKGEDFAKLAK